MGNSDSDPNLRVSGAPATAHPREAVRGLLLVGGLHRRQRCQIIDGQRLVDEVLAADRGDDVLQGDLGVVLAEEVGPGAREADPRPRARGAAQRADVVGPARGVVGELAAVPVVADRRVGGHGRHRRCEAGMTRVDLRVPDERVPLHDRSAGRGRVAGVRDGARDGPVPGQLLQREQPGRPGGRRVVSGVGPVVVGPADAGAAAVGPPVVRHGPSIGTAGQARYVRAARLRCPQGQPAAHDDHAMAALVHVLQDPVRSSGPPSQATEMGDAARIRRGPGASVSGRRRP